MYLACQAFPWMVICGRRGVKLADQLDEVLRSVAEAGCDGWEMFLEEGEQVAAEAAACERQGLAVRSAYVNARVHDDEAAETIGAIVERVDRIRDRGLAYLVVNPEPIDWNQWQAKSDAELERQVRTLDELGGRLADRGVTLAYHTHDAEMRDGARELHHTLIHTDPEKVSFCLDAHWVFRGCGDSPAAVSDIVHLYGDRVSTLHLRQSRGGAWTETFDVGDLDYPVLMRRLADRGFDGPLVLEQIIERDAALELDPGEALRRSVAAARKLPVRGG